MPHSRRAPTTRSDEASLSPTFTLTPTLPLPSLQACTYYASQCVLYLAVASVGGRAASFTVTEHACTLPLPLTPTPTLSLPLPLTLPLTLPYPYPNPNPNPNPHQVTSSLQVPNTGLHVLSPEGPLSRNYLIGTATFGEPLPLDGLPTLTPTLTPTPTPTLTPTPTPTPTLPQPQPQPYP